MTLKLGHSGPAGDRYETKRAISQFPSNLLWVLVIGVPPLAEALQHGVNAATLASDKSG